MSFYSFQEDTDKVVKRIKRAANGDVLYASIKEIDDVERNKDKGFKKPGWYKYKKLRGPDGKNYFKKELIKGLLRSGNISKTYTETQDDDSILADSDYFLVSKYMPPVIGPFWVNPSDNTLGNLPATFLIRGENELQDEEGNKVTSGPALGGDLFGRMYIGDADNLEEYPYKRTNSDGTYTGVNSLLNFKLKTNYDYPVTDRSTFSLSHLITTGFVKPTIQFEMVYTNAAENLYYTIPIAKYNRTIEFKSDNPTSAILYSGDNTFYDNPILYYRVRPYTTVVEGVDASKINKYALRTKVINPDNNSVILDHSEFPVDTNGDLTAAANSETRSDTYIAYRLNTLPVWLSTHTKLALQVQVTNHDIEYHRSRRGETLTEIWNSAPITIDHRTKSSNANLASITITNAPSSFTFNKATTTYSIRMPSASVVITAVVPEDTEFAAVTIGGQVRTLPYTITVPTPAKTITVQIAVVAHDGTAKAYNFTFTIA